MEKSYVNVHIYFPHSCRCLFIFSTFSWISSLLRERKFYSFLVASKILEMANRVTKKNYLQITKNKQLCRNVTFPLNFYPTHQIMDSTKSQDNAFCWLTLWPNCKSDKKGKFVAAQSFFLCSLPIALNNLILNALIYMSDDIYHTSTHRSHNLHHAKTINQFFLVFNLFSCRVRARALHLQYI